MTKSDGHATRDQDPSQIVARLVAWADTRKLPVDSATLCEWFMRSDQAHAKGLAALYRRNSPLVAASWKRVAEGMFDKVDPACAGLIGALDAFLPKPVLKPKPRQEPIRQETHQEPHLPPARSSRYGSLGEAIAALLGDRKALATLWPAGYKPHEHTLAELGEAPLRTLRDNRRLLSVIHDILGDDLPLAAYPQELRVKLDEPREAPLLPAPCGKGVQQSERPKR